MSKLIKRVLSAMAAFVVTVLFAAILIPILFKDKILAVVKTGMNDNLNAVSDFKDVNLSLFLHFPMLTVGIEDIRIIGKGAFANDTLIAADKIEVALDLMKALNGKYDIQHIALISPRIHALVHPDGKANWDIAKPDTTTSKSSASEQPFALKLRRYAFENAYIEYKDEVGKMYVKIEHLNHSGSGDFTSEKFKLSTNTTADAITYAMGNITYLSKVRTAIDLDLDIDNTKHYFGFNTEKIQLNGLKLATKGFIQLPDSLNTLMDVQFSTPSNDFKDILSMVPAIYQNNFKDVKTTGKAVLSGKVLGSMNKQHLPTFHINLAIADGSFQYPDLPQKVNNIQIKLNVDNADGLPDHTIVNLQKGHIEFGTEPFDFTLLLKTPISNQWIDATMKGKIDLSKMQQIMKLESGTKIAGVIDANVAVKGFIAAAQKQQYDQLDAKGTVGITGLQYASKDYPDGVSVNSMMLTFTPKNVTMTNLKGKYLETSFTGDGYINNLLGFYLHSEALEAAFHFSADKLDVTRFMTATSDKPTAKADSPATVFLVPDNLDVTVKAEVGTVIYDKLTLTGVVGAMVVRNQVINLQNVSSNGLEGTIKMNGFYGTKTDKKNPDIQFDYDVQGLDITKTYNSFATIQKMFPAGKYATGKMSSKLTMAGKLGGDMAPVMNTLTGKGEMSLLSGTLGGFPVTDALATKLALPQLKSLPLKDMKLFFHFENGRLAVDPYKVAFNQMELEIAGSHGFDQTLQYGLNINLPMSLLGAQGNALVGNLLSQASSKGITIKQGDKVNLTATITGTITNPKIETNLKNMVGSAVDNVKKQIEEEARHKADSIKSVVKDTVKAVKNQIVNAAKDDLKKQFLGDTTKKQSTEDVIKDVGDKAKNSIKNIFGKKK